MKRKKRQSPDKSLVQELRQLLGHVDNRRRRQLALLLILMTFSSLSEVVSLGAVMPFLAALSNAERLLRSEQLKPLLELFQIETAEQLVVGFALTFVTSVIVANGLRILTINVQARLAGNISSDLTCQLYRKMLLQPYSFYMQRDSGDLINLIMGDTKALSNKVLVPLLACVTNSFTILAIVGGLFLINARVSMTVTVVLGGVYIAIYRLRRKLLLNNSQMMVQSRHRQIRTVQEGLGGIRDILLEGSQGFFEAIHRRADRAYYRAAVSTKIASVTPRYVVEATAMVIIGLLALGFGQGGDFSQAIPVLGSMALGANRLLPAIQQSFAALFSIQGARVSLQRVLTGLGSSIDPLQIERPETGLDLQKDLCFDQVWFRYSNDADWVLKDLNLSVVARTTIGIVGSTGSGKSTVADLILGLLRPQKGAILVDGQPLTGERLQRWQQTIAHVPQSIFLADATIAENIAFGIPMDQIDIEQVYKAARLAQIDEFVQGLPAQYDTYVGERGIRLSGGQRQRIGIARALYRKASVIVFDEATSALDNVTEKEVMAAINGLSSQFTIILIAHRLSTVENCDRIFELDQGKVVCSGTYQELMHGSSTFLKQAKSIS